MGTVAVTRRILAVQFTVPALTASSAPTSQVLALGQTQIVGVRIVIPKGHVGLTGLQVLNGGTRILPWDDASAWIVGDGEVFDVDLNTQAAATMTLRGFNTGQLRHTFYLRFEVDDDLYLRRPVSGLLVPL